MQELLYEIANHPYCGVRQTTQQEQHRPSAEVIPVHELVPLTTACRESMVPRRKQPGVAKWEEELQRGPGYREDPEAVGAAEKADHGDSQ